MAATFWSFATTGDVQPFLEGVTGDRAAGMRPARDNAVGGGMVAALCRCGLQCTTLRAAKAIVATATVTSVLTVMIQMSCFVRLSIVAPDPSATLTAVQHESSGRPLLSKSILFERK